MAMYLTAMYLLGFFIAFSIYGKLIGWILPVIAASLSRALFAKAISLNQMHDMSRG